MDADEFMKHTAQIRQRVVERETARSTNNPTALSQADKNVADSIGISARVCPNPVAATKLRDIESKYRTASSADKDKIIDTLSKAYLVHKRASLAIAGVTTMALIGIGSLTPAYEWVDQYGKIQTDHVVNHQDGTADVYLDSNNNGILDHVRSYQGVPDSSGGISYVPTSDVHDPNVVDSVGDFWDVAKDAIEKVFDLF